MKRQRKQPRRGIDEGTWSAGLGLLTLDVQEGRVLWTLDEMNRMWDEIAVVYRRYSRRVMRRHADKFMADNSRLEDPVYIGATWGSPAMTAQSVASLRRNGMRLVQEILAERRGNGKRSRK